MKKYDNYICPTNVIKYINNCFFNIIIITFQK